MLEIREPEDAAQPADDGPPVQSNVYTVDEAVEYLGFGRFQLTLSFLTGLAWMADAMEMMILSILAPALYCEWKISTVEQAMVSFSKTFLLTNFCVINLFFIHFLDNYLRLLRHDAVFNCMG